MISLFGKQAMKLKPGPSVDCQRCAELLAAYKQAVSLYTAAQRRIRGLRGDEFKLTWGELKRLRAGCKSADEALLAHWREEHKELAEKAGPS
jgi:hypothetical protein